MKVGKSELKPFLSVLLIIFTLLSLAFTKMEMRRLGYSVLKLSREVKLLAEHKRLSEMRLAKLTRPDRIEDLAHNRLSLKKAGKGQIIQLAGQTIALRH